MEIVSAIQSEEQSLSRPLSKIHFRAENNVLDKHCNRRYNILKLACANSIDYMNSQYSKKYRTKIVRKMIVVNIAANHLKYYT
jgi:hypothetical protein